MPQLNRDLNANNSDEDDAEAWFHEAVPNTGDQNMNMPPASTVQALNRDVLPVRETIQDRVGRKYKQMINDKKAAAELGSSEVKNTLGYQKNAEEQARF